MNYLIISLSFLFSFCTFKQTPKILEVGPAGNHFLNITDAVNSATPGDTILAHSGVYNESFEITKSGNALKPITILAKDNNVILDGSKPLAGWKRCEAPARIKGNINWRNIYYTEIPPNSNRININLFQDEKRLSIAQHPRPLDAFYDKSVDDYIRLAVR